MTLEDLVQILKVSKAFLSEMENDIRDPVPDSKLPKFLEAVGRPDCLGELAILAAYRRGSMRLNVRGLPQEAVARVAEFCQLAAGGLSESQWKAILTIARQK